MLNKTGREVVKKFYKGKSVAVVGGAGYIGSALVARLKKLGAAVSVMDLKDGCDYSTADEFTFTSKLCNTSNVIFNLACTNIIDCEDPEMSGGNWSNIALAARVARYARRRGAKLVHFSSSSVYGPVRGLSVHNSTHHEANTLAPSSEYGWSKARGEEAVRHYCPSAVVLRPVNVFGPSPNPNWLGIINRLAYHKANGTVTPINGDSREFVYIEDLVDVALLVGADVTTHSIVFNVGSGTERSIPELAALMGARTSYSTAPSIGNIKQRRVNSHRLCFILGDVFSFTPFNKALAITMDHARKA